MSNEKSPGSRSFVFRLSSEKKNKLEDIAEKCGFKSTGTQAINDAIDEVIAFYISKSMSCGSELQETLVLLEDLNNQVKILNIANIELLKYKVKTEKGAMETNRILAKNLKENLNYLAQK